MLFGISPQSGNPPRVSMGATSQKGAGSIITRRRNVVKKHICVGTEERTEASTARYAFPEPHLAIQHCVTHLVGYPISAESSRRPDLKIVGLEFRPWRICRVVDAAGIQNKIVKVEKRRVCACMLSNTVLAFRQRYAVASYVSGHRQLLHKRSHYYIRYPS